MGLEKFEGEHKCEAASGLGESLEKRLEAKEKAALFEEQDLQLTEEEKAWFDEKSEEISDEEFHDISFKGSVTCLGGRAVCTGCAGILIDKKYGCQSGACTGGKRIPK